jgi:hypothetical protein
MAVVLDTSALPATGAVDRVHAAAEWQEKCSPFPGGHTEELAKSGRRGNCHSSASRLSKSPIFLDQAKKVTDSNFRIVGSIRRRLKRRGAGRRFRGVGRFGQQD